ncbi:UDP-glucose/GDP-mannose dehydrogenase family protein [Saccharothrix longispora]|uniref:UDP-glucose dehydrogenase family protein n=1 Tax=Saccharothrix longispora TaxID=33920 RepID=UPI0028FD04F2|nr:UDP-glucose/GDP-mannose dehydrogenase family protein [Saccharothrix longispora]MDU0289613.1 UDP-glucose/GDP-mannose dehydrogenase family protein [Saccharothrix longispora]
MFVRRIAVVGTGYVGLTTGACLASLGHRVVCADVDALKVARLRAGQVDILEPDLADLVARGRSAGRLNFVEGARYAVADAEVVFLCLPTPMGAGGAADLSAVEAVAGEIRDVLPRGAVVVCKSTVPVGTSTRVAALLGRDDVAVVSNPEFLREGSAVRDFLHPDRIVVGADSPRAAERVAALFAKLGAPTVLMDAASAEMVKYAANCFLAMKLSYVNAVAELCELVGADVASVTEGMGHDRRIGQSFLRPGPGWGGSCLPKDTHAMVRIAEAVGVDFSLVKATIETNGRQQRRVVDKLRAAVGTLAGTRIGVLGLAFKAGTNDLRDSPALAVAELLAFEGAELVAHDPQVDRPLVGMTVVGDPYAAVRGADAVVLLTDWPEFRSLDWARVADGMTGSTVLDTRDHLDPDALHRAGLVLLGLGREPARDVGAVRVR